MKNILRNAALAVSVLSLGATASPVFGHMVSGTKGIYACPLPTCPVSDPNGCGIYRPKMQAVSGVADLAK